MCGFLFCFNKNDLNLSKSEFLSSLDNINHRGPDSSGYYEFIHNDYILRFGHKRLAINELSINGSQPIESISGRFILLFNGEIFNHSELRQKFNHLFDFNWKGKCDSETLVNLFEYLDIEVILKELSGQFSFVIFDKKDCKIIMSRDIVGEKPLYIFSNNKCFAASSDLITFKKLSFFNKSISKIGFSKYLKYNYISAPDTIYEHCFKLPQSSFLKVKLNNFTLKRFNNFNSLIDDKYIDYRKYWSLKKNNNFNSEKNHLKNVKEILNSSIKEQLMSDVPLGVFFSG